MYKFKGLIALVATLAWLGFIYLAFRGFHFWYEGFVLFFWIALGALNYRHESTLWLLKNRPKIFALFYLVLAIFLFYGDYGLGRYITHLWIYPYHLTFWSQLRIYVMYPL